MVSVIVVNTIVLAVEKLLLVVVAVAVSVAVLVSVMVVRSVDVPVK